MIGLMKRESVAALVLLLLIPAVLMLGGFLFALINPEIGAGHANYVLTFHLLSRLRVAVFFGSGVVALVLWFLVCFLVIRSKQRSQWWLLLAALGPLGLAILATLNDPAPRGARPPLALCPRLKQIAARRLRGMQMARDMGARLSGHGREAQSHDPL